MKTCPECAHGFDDSDLYCPYDGQALVASPASAADALAAPRETQVDPRAPAGGPSVAPSGAEPPARQRSLTSVAVGAIAILLAVTAGYYLLRPGSTSSGPSDAASRAGADETAGAGSPPSPPSPGSMPEQPDDAASSEAVVTAEIPESPRGTDRLDEPLIPAPAGRAEKATTEPPPPRPAPAGRRDARPPARAPARPQRSEAQGRSSEPVLIKRIVPSYPEMAKRARVEGVVYLAMSIDEAGSVFNVTVTRGNRFLDSAAIEAVRQWVYSPALVNGRPVRSHATARIEFRLQ